jgi:hypothetical protein
MRFLYGTGTEYASGLESPSELIDSASNENVERLKQQLLIVEERAQKAEKHIAVLKKQIEQITTAGENQFAVPYGDELEWLFTTEQGHSTLRMTPIYSRVQEHVQQQLNEHVGVKLTSPQFIGIACCAVECLLQAADVDWKSDFKGLRGKVTARHQTALLRRFVDVLCRGIKTRPPGSC